MKKFNLNFIIIIIIIIISGSGSGSKYLWFRTYFGSALCFICCLKLSVAIVFVGQIQWFVSGGQALCVGALSVCHPTLLLLTGLLVLSFLSYPGISQPFNLFNYSQCKFFCTDTRLKLNFRFRYRCCQAICRKF